MLVNAGLLQMKSLLYTTVLVNQNAANPKEFMIDLRSAGRVYNASIQNFFSWLTWNTNSGADTAYITASKF